MLFALPPKIIVGVVEYLELVQIKNLDTACTNQICRPILLSCWKLPQLSVTTKTTSYYYYNYFKFPVILNWVFSKNLRPTHIIVDDTFNVNVNLNLLQKAVWLEVNTTFCWTRLLPIVLACSNLKHLVYSCNTREDLKLFEHYNYPHEMLDIILKFNMNTTDLVYLKCKSLRIQICATNPILLSYDSLCSMLTYTIENPENESCSCRGVGQRGNGYFAYTQFRLYTYTKSTQRLYMNTNIRTILELAAMIRGLVEKGVIKSIVIPGGVYNQELWFDCTKKLKVFELPIMFIFDDDKKRSFYDEREMHIVFESDTSHYDNNPKFIRVDMNSGLPFIVCPR